MSFHYSRTTLLQSAALVALLIISLSATWLLASRPWRIDAVIGGADSAIVGTGFLTKELSPEGVPFRWTSGPAIINLPLIRSVYLVSFHVYTPDNTLYPVTIKDRLLPIVTVPLQPSLRTYHVLWQSPPTYHWFELFAPRRIIIDAGARNVNPNDQRALGVALLNVQIQGLRAMEAPVGLLVLMGVTLLAFSRLWWPLQGKKLMIFAGMALVLPFGYDLLVWHPPTGHDYTWLPLAWLPGVAAAVALGMALAQVARGSTKAALVVGGIMMIGAIAILTSLQWHWSVEGPDYGWHLNHGGSWGRVFRAHPFYPFGLPLILWLGQLANDQTLLFGRLAGMAATILAIGATMLLVWRLIGSSYAWLGVILMLASPIVVAYGVLASTDAPMAGFAALALLALAWREHPSIRQIALAGISLGLAYLFRFQAIVLLIPMLMWLCWQPAPTLPVQAGWLHRLGRFTGPFLLLVGFLIASAPQWLLDIRDTGRPFATQQYVNIWLFAFDRYEAVPGTSTLEQLWFILNFDPYRLWRHWLENIRQFGMETVHRLLIWPVGLLTLGGIALVKEFQERRYLLLLLWIIIYTGIVTLTANKERFFLPILPACVVFVIAWLAKMNDFIRSFGDRWAFLSVCIQAGLFYWMIIHVAMAEYELASYGFVHF